MSLPFENEIDISIATNEYVNAETINRCLRRLHANDLSLGSSSTCPQIKENERINQYVLNRYFKELFQTDVARGGTLPWNNELHIRLSISEYINQFSLNRVFHRLLTNDKS
jgi:hypothetical protein